MSKESMLMFVCSHEGSLDSERYFEKALSKFWKDCPYKIYLANNSKNSKYTGNYTLIRSQQSDWTNETYNQINILKNLYPKCSHVFLMLDDFVLGSKVITSEILRIHNLAKKEDLNYVQLTKVEGSFFSSFFLKKDLNSLCKIPENHPYYSSLHPAIWKIDHLLKLLKSPESIWKFEEQVGQYNHMSVDKTLIHYKHIVEKGEWDTSAESWCTKKLGFFDKGERQTIKYSPGAKIRLLISKILFLFFGYSVFRLRKKLNF